VSRLAVRGPFLLLFAVNQQLDALLARALSEAPLRPGEFAIYSALRLEQPTTPSVLARTLGLRATTMSSHVQKMSERGHLVRRAHPTDGRSSLIALSDAGLSATEACFPPFAAAIEAFRLALGADGVVDEQSLLEHLEAASRAVDEAARRLATGQASDPTNPTPPDAPPTA
jgi:DNA-binding MarR family transcriptional regulator